MDILDGDVDISTDGRYKRERERELPTLDRQEYDREKEKAKEEGPLHPPCRPSTTASLHSATTWCSAVRVPPLHTTRHRSPPLASISLLDLDSIDCDCVCLSVLSLSTLSLLFAPALGRQANDRYCAMKWLDLGDLGDHEALRRDCVRVVTVQQRQASSS